MECAQVNLILNFIEEKFLHDNDLLLLTITAGNHE